MTIRSSLPGAGRSVAFLATARTGLGHLRRIASIARRLRALGPGLEIVLVCNAQPDGLSAPDRAGFSGFVMADRDRMPDVLQAGRFDLAVLDTMRLPGSPLLPCPAILILRETPDDRLADFRRSGGRPWDAVILPNPPTEWRPDLDEGIARRVEAVGWISRRSGPRRPEDPPAGIVVATGGGGTPESRALLYPLLDRVIADARARCSRPFLLRQALGPRSGGAALHQADEIFDPGGSLDTVFRSADLVISTAGYNSVLELASTDTPALLAAIPRSLDDQQARVRRWGQRLGHGLDPGYPHAASVWLARSVEAPVRRAPVDLGPDGASRAAAVIMEYL